MTAITKHSERESPIATAHGTEYTRDQIDLIKRTICQGGTDDELQMFVQTAQRLGLDPFARQIFAVKRRAKVDGYWTDTLSIQVSIDGFRLTAQRSGEYAGQTATEWCGRDGQWREVWLDREPPAAARVGVYRRGFAAPTYAVARWDSYCQTTKEGRPTSMWAKMPDLMLAKCAEALALRKAFPAELSGVYTPDEMAQESDPTQVTVHDNRGANDDHGYHNPEAVEERERAVKVAEGFAAEVLPGLEESIAEAAAEMADAGEREADEAELEAIRNGHYNALCEWVQHHGPRYIEVCSAHPACGNAKSKVYRRLVNWCKEVGISESTPREVLAELVAKQEAAQ